MGQRARHKAPEVPKAIFLNRVTAVRQPIFGTILFAAIIATTVVAAQATDYVADADRLTAKGDLKAAEIQLKNAVRSDPKNMVAHYRLAVIELQLGQAAAAEREASTARDGGYDLDRTVPLLAETYLVQQKFRQLLEDFPADTGSNVQRAGVLVARGYAQLGLGKSEEARESFQSAQNFAPQAPGPVLAQAKLLMLENKFASAEPLFDQVLQLDPKSNDARLAKAHLFRLNGNPAEALSRLNDVITDSPGYWTARLERAEILLAENKDEAAKTDIDAVLAVQPGSVAGIYLKAVLAAKGKDFGTANTNLQKIAKAISTIPRGYYLQALVSYNLRHLEQAEDAARRHVARNAGDLAGAKLLAVIELALGRPADAIDALAKFEDESKADAGALDLLGRAYTQVGKTSEALAAFSAAVKAAPTNAELRTRLGGIQLRAGNTAEAITDLEQSLELAPSAPAAEMLVLTELVAGRWEEASTAATKLQKAQPDSPVADNLMGLITLARFDLEGARSQFAKLAKKYPKFLPAQLNLARALELQAKPAEAQEVFKRILEEQPTNGVALTRFVELSLRIGQGDTAVVSVERAHAAAPDNRAITAGLIDLYIRHGDKDKALKIAREENGSNDRANAVVIAARARAEFAAGLKNEAAATYRRLIDIAPKQVDLRRQLAAVLVSVGDVAGAQQEIDQAVQIEPHNALLAADRISIELKSSGISGAVAIAKQLQAKNPDWPVAEALEGDAYMAAGEFAKAAEAYTKQLQRNPSAILTMRLARAKSAEAGPDTAASVLREWLKGHPDDDSVAGLLGTYDLLAHRFDDARNELEQIVAKVPQNAVALNNLAWLYQRVGDPRALSLAERAYLIAPNLPQTADTLGWILVQRGEAATAVGE